MTKLQTNLILAALLLATMYVAELVPNEGWWHYFGISLCIVFANALGIIEGRNNV